MAGGIGRPFEFNMKCIIFVLAIMLAYYELPEKDNDIWIKYIPIITTLVILSYYFLYSCQNINILLLISIIVIVTIILQYVYWNMPRGLWSAYYAIFFFGYIALAYFDYVMDCSIPLKAGWLSFTHLFKIRD